MTRRGRGRISPEDSADLRHRAVGVVSARAARGERPITGAELARELEVSPQTGRALLAHLRDLELAPPAVVSAAGRQMAAPPAGGRTVWLSAARLAHLATLTTDAAAAGLDVGAYLARARLLIAEYKQAVARMRAETDACANANRSAAHPD